MSRTNVVALKYTLTKYSRLYSSVGVANPEWQHYSDPLISLLLETTKTELDELEAMRLRIGWTSSGGSLTDSNQSLITFEDIDLVAHSSARLQPALGPPLKAVYKGNMVGIRYLWPIPTPPGQAASFRHLKIAFISPADASQFVDTIRMVCPCIANPPPGTAAGLHRNLTTMSGSTTTFTPTRPSNAASRITTQASILARSQSLMPVTSLRPPPLSASSISANETRSRAPSRTLPASPPPDPAILPPLTTAYPFVNQKQIRASSQTLATILSVEPSSDFDTDPASTSSDTHYTIKPSSTLQPPARHQASDQNRYVPMQRHDINSSSQQLYQVASPAVEPSQTPLPSHSPFTPSSLPPSSLESASSIEKMPPPPLPNSVPITRGPSPMHIDVPTVMGPTQANESRRRSSDSNFQETQTSSQSQEIFTKAMRAVPELYELSDSELEVLMTQVIHEDGFLHLMQRLSRVMGGYDPLSNK